MDEGGSIVNDGEKIAAELLSYHKSSMEENSSVPPGNFMPVCWEKPFLESDNIINIPNQLVADCVSGLKNSTVPDNISPLIIKLLFSSRETVAPLGEMIRAVARTRAFPDGGKIAKQIFC